ncbi:DUF998 domain-containing protein [Actinoplanes sp. NPDC048796]|uniref:DUF998 domain-containing protein n=1 Tax=unclassified Actinoplanes TaxID=2626549 RepID=UPI003409C8AE
MIRTRFLAVASALAVTGGAVTMLVALVAAPGSWLAGYVSEAGTAGVPYAVPYRAGLVVLAVGVALLGAAVRIPLASPALFAAAGLAAVSGVVPCTNQCPLPPYEPTTPADVVHASATILGMLMLAAAMAAMWWYAGDRTRKGLAAGGVALTVPLGAALGLTMLLAGRGTLGATLERLLLAEAVVWLVGTAVTTALTTGGKRRT